MEYCRAELIRDGWGHVHQIIDGELNSLSQDSPALSWNETFSKTQDVGQAVPGCGPGVLPWNGEWAAPEL